LSRIAAFLLMITFLSLTINGEYRVYQYYIKAKSRFAFDQQPYLVTSSYPPTTYLAYYGGSGNIKLDLLRTWFCPGHTGEKVYCPAPLESLESGDGDKQ
jgi:hypothetical protein